MDNYMLKATNEYIGNMLPTSYIYEDSDGAREFDLRTLHLSDGILFMNGTIDRDMAMKFASSMLVLSAEKRDVRIYINSEGGEVNAGLMMYDIMQSFDGKMELFCIGRAASMAAVLLAGGQKGRRFILPHSKVLIHEPLIAGGFGGSASTIERTAKSILEVRDLTNGIIAKHTGHTLEEVNAATEHDNEMSAVQAIEFGLCDEIRSFF
ncbi:MAG: ATP-dependent Clp protease proteolytic subunit [Ruminococcus sp.]|nr:ATP-dependent Clp protease proteolytic subunit [Ruminococcus sp.]